MDGGYPYDDPKPSTDSRPSDVIVGQTAEDYDVTSSLTNIEVYYVVITVSMFFLVKHCYS